MIEARIVFITALINLAAVVLIFFSCRCFNTWKPAGGINKQTWYKKYFRWHCYLWYILLPSLVIHAVLAIRLMGVPF